VQVQGTTHGSAHRREDPIVDEQSSVTIFCIFGLLRLSLLRVRVYRDRVHAGFSLHRKDRLAGCIYGRLLHERVDRRDILIPSNLILSARDTRTPVHALHTQRKRNILHKNQLE
jgi:hypothetical protein